MSKGQAFYMLNVAKKRINWKIQQSLNTSVINLFGLITEGCKEVIEC